MTLPNTTHRSTGRRTLLSGSPLAFLLLISSLASAAPGDVLYVQVNSVAFRDAPNEDAAVIMTLERGQRLMELDRQGDWINVGADGTGGKIAWLPLSAVGPNEPAQGSAVPSTQSFDEFEDSFPEINSDISSKVGTEPLFRDPVYDGDGIIYVYPTESWQNSDPPNRSRALNLLFSHWSVIESTGSPIAIYVLGQNGDVLDKVERGN